MTDKTLVLGSGVSALAYLLYDPDAFSLAGEQVGGMFAQQAKLGPQVLWCDRLTERLLQDLNLPTERRLIHVGYCYAGSIHAAANPEILAVYAKKTRGIEPKSTFMSSGRESYEAYVVPVDKIVEALLDRVQLRLIRRSALSIDLYSQEVATNTAVFAYDKLVSTIPAPKFLQLCGHSQLVPRLIARDKVYQKIPTSSPSCGLLQPVLSSFDYIYVVDDDLPFHRIRAVGEDSAILEFTLRPDSQLPAASKDIVLHPRGQIIAGKELLSALPSSVLLLGRYAAWDHSIKLNQVLEIIHGT